MIEEHLFLAYRENGAIVFNMGRSKGVQRVKSIPSPNPRDNLWGPKTLLRGNYVARIRAYSKVQQLNT